MTEQELFAVAFAGLWSSAHTARIMTNRGLVSPSEVDEIYGSIVEALQHGGEEFAAKMTARLDGSFAEMRQTAQRVWIGKGKTDPR